MNNLLQPTTSAGHGQAGISLLQKAGTEKTGIDFENGPPPKKRKSLLLLRMETSELKDPFEHKPGTTMTARRVLGDVVNQVRVVDEGESQIKSKSKTQADKSVGSSNNAIKRGRGRPPKVPKLPIKIYQDDSEDATPPKPKMENTANERNEAQNLGDQMDKAFAIGADNVPLDLEQNNRPEVQHAEKSMAGQELPSITSKPEEHLPEPEVMAQVPHDDRVDFFNEEPPEERNFIYGDEVAHAEADEFNMGLDIGLWFDPSYEPNFDELLEVDELLRLAELPRNYQLE